MLVSAGSAVFDVDLIVFDKDGTLIDLDATWLDVGRVWIDHASAGDSELAELLASELGLTAEGLDPTAVLAIGTIDEIERATRKVLLGVGVESAASVASARQAALAMAEIAPVYPIGDVSGSFNRLHEAGLVLAIASSDEERFIRKHLEDLGIADLVSGVASGDGPYPSKPSPDSLLYLSEVTGVTPDRMLMVGDSDNDLGAARRAGAAGVVAVTEDSSLPLGIAADSVVASVDEILVLDRGVGERTH